MKICPSCNARVSEDAAVCRSCDHQFEGETKAQKKTMMGMPVVGDENTGAPDDAPKDGDSNIDRSKLAGMLDKAKERAGETSDEEPEHDATQRIDSSQLSGMMGESQDVDDDERTADAWGLGAESSGESPQDAGATEVVNPDELNFPESMEDDFSLSDAQPAATRDEPEPEPEPVPGRDKQKFGTLKGMSLDDDDQEGAAGAAMQFGGGGGDDGGDEDSTQALSPDQLAQVEEMGFGDSKQQQGDSGSADRLPMGDQETADQSDQKTAVLDDSMTPGNFQLRKPGQSQDEPDPDGASGEKSQEDAQQRPGRESKRDTPRSGVFRAAGQKTSDDDKKTDGGGDKSDSANLSDSGVTGTGTYSMSTSNSGDSSETPFEASEQELKLGAVGSGGRTDFPAGAEENDDADSAQKESVTGNTSAPETGPIAESSTGPAFGIGQPDDDEGTSGAGAQPVRQPESSGVEAGGGQSAASQAEPGPEDVTSDDAIAETGGVEQVPADAPEMDLADIDLGSSPEADSAQQSGAAAPDATTDPSREQAPQPESPQPESPQPGQFGADKADPAPEVQPGAGGEAPGAAAGPAPSSEPSDLETPAASENAAGAMGPSSGIGADAGQSDGVTASTESTTPTPGQVEPGDAAPAANQPIQSMSEPASVTDEEGAGEVSSGADRDVAKIVMLLQRGFGALAAVAMIVVTVAAVVLGGVPDGGGGFAITMAPIVFGLIAIALTVLSMADQKRTIGFAVTGGLSIASFAGALAVGGSILAIGLFAGGALLLFAAGFPKIATVIEQG